MLPHPLHADDGCGVCTAQQQPPTFAYAGLFGANAGAQPGPAAQPQQGGFGPGLGQSYGPQAPSAQPARYGIMPPPPVPPAIGGLALPPPGVLPSFH